MKHLLDKYAAKLTNTGLTVAGVPLLGGLDAELVWNRDDAACTELEEVFARLNINSMLYARPAEPYATIIDYLSRATDGAIRPNDSETRTIMHDLPVVNDFDAALIVGALKQRKSVIIPGHGVVTWGTVSPEQAFVFFSSLCFGVFVKFFSDFLRAHRHGHVTAEQQTAFDTAVEHLHQLPTTTPPLLRSPFVTEEDVYRAVSEAGRAIVDYQLVDSFFGNVSYHHDDVLYISQTGSSLDELEGCIDACPRDGSSCAAITASSELTAHREIVGGTGCKAILHGHPKFSVILSLDCEKEDCDHCGECHIKCPEARMIEDIPVVPGEVGTGRYGLCHTLPPAMQGRRGVIVYGHGLFTTGAADFNDAFGSLLAVERMCQALYFERLNA